LIKFILFFTIAMNNLITPKQQFGKHLLDLFFLDKQYVNVNHGSYGSPPRAVIAKHRQYQEECDHNTEKWFRYTVFERLNETIKAVASYVNADAEDIVLVENASDGVNSVFRSLNFKQGDKILVFDCAYAMVKSLLQYLEDNNKIQIIRFVLDTETLNSDEKIIQALKDLLEKEGPIQFASFDHIPSVPHVILPIKELTQILKNHNTTVFIDGAHTVGQIPVDIKDINPHFYLSNFHKWGYAPKSVSFLYVAKEFQEKVHPNIITAFYKKGFSNEYAYTGTRDYSSHLTIKDALEFRKQFGEKEIMEYINNLAWEAGKEVARVWGTEMLIKDKSRIGSMVNVRIPISDDAILAKAVYKCLYEHNTFVVVYKHNDGNSYTRMSAQIYNEISDYTYAAETFLKVINELKASKEN